MASPKTPAYLVLADGTVFEGFSFGYAKTTSGEVVFNTSLAGYQEILTDPSYKGQIVVMTYPQIGNYGIVPDDSESRGLFLSGFIVKENSPVASNYRSRMTLSAYLKKHRIPGLEGIDTRALVRHIREKGSMPAFLVVGKKGLAQARKQAAKIPGMEGQDLALAVTCQKAYSWTQGVKRLKSETFATPKAKPKYKVIAYDFGIKHNILRQLVEAGCKVKVVPAKTSAEKVLAENPDGVFLSNGPGDPAVCTYAVEAVKKLLGKKPIFGICLGHQILGLALGANTYKLKFGHHGGNQPVMDLSTRKVEITAQNHGFAVDSKNLPKNVDVTHINLNDQTVEGIANKKLKAFSVQYHPEAAPGPHDAHYLFGRFIDLMKQS